MILSSISHNSRALTVLLALSVLLFFVTAATYSSLGVVLPDMVKEMGWNWSQAGLGFTLLGVACGASSWLPRILIRKLGVQTALIVGTVVMTGGLASLGLGHGLPMYFGGAIACGIGYQMMALIPGTHVIASLFENRARAMGFYFAAASIGGIAGPWMVFAVLSMLDWRQFWYLQSGACLLIGIVCAVLIGRLALPKPDVEGAKPKAQPPAAAAPGSGWTVKEALRTPQFYILLAAYFSHLLSGVTVASVSVAHLTEHGVALGVAGAMLSLESIMGLASRMGAGIIGDRISAKTLLLFALAANVAGCFALSVADSYPLMVLYAAGTGIGFGLTIVATTILLLDYFGREHNLEIFSLTCLVGALSALGPFISGIIRDATGSFAPAFQIYGVVIALIGVLTIFMRPPVRKTAATLDAGPMAVPMPGE